MKNSNKFFTAISLAATITSAQALDLEVSVNALYHGLGDSLGVDLPAGNLVRVGYFAVDPAASNFTQLADSVIFANRFDFDFLNARFVQFGTNIFTGSVDVGNGQEPGFSSSQFYANLGGAPGNFTGKNHFLWAFNRATLPIGGYTAGDEIFIGKSNGTFLSGIDEFSISSGIGLELLDIPVANIIVGGYGLGTVDPSPNNDGTIPLYNTAPVPEPSAALAIISGVAVLCGLRRRRA